MPPTTRCATELVPINRKYPLTSLIAACNRYLEAAPRDFITFEYVMLEGVNDTEAHAREAAGLARSVRCKFNLIPFNPFAGVGLPALEPGAHPALRRDPAARRHHGDDAQDPRRRHRRRLRPARGRCRRPHPAEPPPASQGGACMKTIPKTIMLLLVAACAADPAREGPGADTRTQIGEVGEPRNRARIHTELAAAYFERGNMAVALEELRVAAGADSDLRARPTACSGWCTWSCASATWRRKTSSAR